MPIQDLFGYQPPNDDTKPRFAWLDSIYHATLSIFRAILEERVDPNVLMTGVIPSATREQFEPITEACRAFVDAMKMVCPPSADQTAAVRNVRLARMYANNALLQKDCFSPGKDYEHALDQLKMAWFQANASIALALPEELPPL
jgi:hypothetical protein